MMKTKKKTKTETPVDHKRGMMACFVFKNLFAFFLPVKGRYPHMNLLGYTLRSVSLDLVRD